jgi:glycosyltransferase involved in cell wall biosynthesis
MDSEKSNPRVTVVIPVFNQNAGFLRRCIDSVLTQDYPNLEIIVSDNRSDNGCGEIIDSYADPRLKVIRPAVHLPMVQHWAFATFHATGDYLSMMGSDDWAEPHWLSTMMPEIVSHPTASFAFSNLNLRHIKNGDAEPARDLDIPNQLIPSVQAARQVIEWTSHMFSWWVVGAIIRTKDYFAVSGIARYATVHNGDYPLSLGLLTRGDALYINERLANYQIWGAEDGKSDGRRQAIILEDMIRILACIESDLHVRTLCIESGWSIRRIKRRFIKLALLWINVLPTQCGHSAEEQKRITDGLTKLLSMRIALGIFMVPVFLILKVFARLSHTSWKRIAEKLLRT